MNKQVMIVTAVITLTFRLIFATILLLAAREGDTAFLKGVLLVIITAMVTFGLYRFVKMVTFANRIDKLKNVFDK